MSSILEFVFVNGIARRLLAQAYGEGGYSTDAYSPEPRQQIEPAPAQGGQGRSGTSWQSHSANTASPDSSSTSDDEASTSVSSDDEVISETPRPTTATTTKNAEVFSSAGADDSSPSLVLIGGIILILAVVLTAIMLLIKKLRRGSTAPSADPDVSGWNNWQR